MKFNSSWPETDPAYDSDIAEAMEAVREMIPVAASDSLRPRLHFVPPAREMIDAWGGIWYDGYYHLFYDLNASRKKSLGGAFAHIRSRDLLNWEQLPLALIPSEERDELRLNDGCVVIREDGTPLMYYTSVFNDGSRHREHLPVLGDKDLITWERLADEQAITIENHGGPFFYQGWSDPVIFTEGGRTFMLISKCVTEDGKNKIPIYEAEDSSLLKWKYRGIFFDDNGEVINFIKVDGKWVLIFCPYGDPVYFVGDFDIDNCRFRATSQGELSRGFVCEGNENSLISRGFYATTAFKSKDDQTVVLGWLSGFLAPRGWDGCISFPRVLNLDNSGHLLMNPHPVLQTLRKDSRSMEAGAKNHCGPCFELECGFDIHSGGKIIFEIGNQLTVEVDEENIRLNDICYPATNVKHLQLLVDVSVAELFCNNGCYNISRTLEEIDCDAEIAIHPINAILESAKLYTLNK